MPMPEEDNNALDNFRPYEDERYMLEVQDIERDHKNLVGKSSDTESCARVGYILPDGLLENESSLSLKKISFNKLEFPAGTPISNIKYDHPGLQNNILFYPFYNQLDYSLAHYFAKSETTKGKVNNFLSNLLMALLTKKLSY